MKRALLSLLLLVGGLSVATADGQGKIHVVPFKKATITCDASKGNNAYPVWAKFPSTSTSVRKILMHVTLGCPDTIACAHWDYLDHVRLVKAGGASGKVLNYEKEEFSQYPTSATIENSLIIPPCFIGENVKISNSKIGPFVSLGNNTCVINSNIDNSLIQENTVIDHGNLSNSMIGSSAKYFGVAREISLGDYSVLDFLSKD